MQRRVDGFAGPSSSGEAGRCTAQKRPAFGAFCAMRALHGTSSRAVAVARLLSDRQFREQGSRKTVCPFLLRPDAGVHVAGLLSPRFELRIDFPRLRRLIHSRSGSLALRHGLALRHLLLGCPGIPSELPEQPHRGKSAGCPCWLRQTPRERPDSSALLKTRLDACPSLTLCPNARDRT